jgi:predicted PurR-regulated permease PerM
VSSQPQSILTRPLLFAVVFFGLFLVLLYQIARLLTPFLSPLLWAAILTLALHPLHKRIEAIVKGRKTLAASITTLVVLLLVIGPAVTLLIVLSGQAVDMYQWASSVIQSGKLAEVWGKFTNSFLNTMLNHPALAGLDLKELFLKGLGELSSKLTSHLGGILTNTLFFIVDIMIMLISLFFFFRDGEAYYTSSIELLPFTRRQKETIAQNFADTFSAVINGVFLVAMLQGAMTGIGFALFGVPFAVFWGFLAAGLALLPVGGAALVWVPGVAYLYLGGATLPGILLGVWGLVLVSLPDNFLKPLIIGKKAKIPTFVLFIALLGGLQVYGILGILFGPLIVTLLTAFIQIYREEYAERDDHPQT